MKERRRLGMLLRWVGPGVAAVALASCGGITDPRLDHFPRGSVDVSGAATIGFTAVVDQLDTMRVFLNMRNSGPEQAEVGFGLCSFAVKVAGTSFSWDNIPSGNFSCPEVQVVATLGPGAAVDRLIAQGDLRDMGAATSNQPIAVRVFMRQSGRLREYTARVVRE